MLAKTRSSRPSQLVPSSDAITLEGNELNPSLAVCAGMWAGIETVPARDGQVCSQTESNLRECCQHRSVEPAAAG
jgi:hypothetical protein